MLKLIAGLRRRSRLSTFAVGALFVFLLAMGVESQHEGVRPEQHCSESGGHCLVCHGELGTTLSASRPNIEPIAAVVAEDTRPLRCELPSVVALGFSRGRAPPAI